MLDEMKITSRFLTNLVSKVVNLVLRKKLGYDINVKLNEVKAVNDNEKIKVHLDVDCELTREELSKILETAGLN